MLGLTGISGDAYQALTQVAYAQSASGSMSGMTANQFSHITNAPEASHGAAGYGGASADAQRIVLSGVKQILGIVQNTTGARFNIVG